MKAWKKEKNGMIVDVMGSKIEVFLTYVNVSNLLVWYSLEWQKAINFVLRGHTIGLETSRHFSSNQKSNQTQPWLTRTVFPHLV